MYVCRYVHDDDDEADENDVSLYRKSAPNDGRGHHLEGDHEGPGAEALGQIAKKGPRRGNVTLYGLKNFNEKN